MGDATIEIDFARMAVHANGLDATAAELRTIGNRLARLSAGLAMADARARTSVADATSVVKYVVTVLDFERARVAGYERGLVVVERPFLQLPPWHRDAILAGATARFLSDRFGNVISTGKVTGTVDVSLGVGFASVDGRVAVSYTEVVYEDGSRLITVTDGAGIGGTVGTPDVGVPATPSAQLSAMLTGRVGRSYVVAPGGDVKEILLREALLHQKLIEPRIGPLLDQVIARLPKPDLDTTEVEVSGEGKADLVYSEKTVGASFPWVRTEDHKNKTVTTEHGWMTTGSVLLGTTTRAGTEGSVGVNVAVTRDRHGEITTIEVTEIQSATAKVTHGEEGAITASVTTGAGRTRTTKRVIDVSERPDLAVELAPLVEGHDWDLSAVTAILHRHAGVVSTTTNGVSVSTTVGGDIKAAEVKVTVTGETSSVASERLQPPPSGR